jgi:DNA-binding response OmpR family regulator
VTQRVLIAEDERNIVESLRFVLTREGYEVSHALDGAEALALVRREAPDALVLDLMLPKMSGYDVLKEVRADAQTRALPILMLTAKGQAYDRQAAQDLGVDAFMTKPFSNSDVIEQIARLLGGHA